jgi:hypothetical protein
MSSEIVVRALQLQAIWGEAIGSPFTGALMRLAAQDVEEGGPTAAVLGDWTGDPLADALAPRFSGALHAAVLQGRAPQLAAEYPAARADWSMQRIWPLALDFLARDRDWVRAFLESPPQTNETRRSIALLPGFLQLARGGPLHLLELGASAGLNQIWDRYRFETESWSWGEDHGVIVRTDWRGPAPDALDAAVRVASRTGCDRAPLDVRNPDHVLRLRAYVWADQAERLSRLDAAIALAREADVRIEAADAGDWLERKLAPALPEGVTIIYHSVVWQYFSEATRAHVRAVIHAAAARADEERRLAWLRLEPNRALGIEGPMEQMATLLLSWPGAERRVLVRTDGHAAKVEA